jgi:hypothetical protein
MAAGHIGGRRHFAVFGFLGAYFFLLIKDRDALRSEKYTLSKLALERSITGDNIAGFLESRQAGKPFPPSEPTVGDER